MDDKHEKPMTSPFQVIAMSQIKDKKTSKEGSLSDLFKCVTELSNSTQSLGDFMSSITDVTQAEELKRYLDALVKIQTGLLEMAKKRITNIGMVNLGQQPLAPPAARMEG